MQAWLRWVAVLAKPLWDRWRLRQGEDMAGQRRVDLTLRCTIAPALQVLVPEEPACMRCGMPFGIVTPAVLRIGPDLGVMVVCGVCYQALWDSGDRGAYVRLVKAARAEYGWDEPWAVFQAAIEADWPTRGMPGIKVVIGPRPEEDGR